MNKKVSAMDVRHLRLIREQVEQFLARHAKQHDVRRARILDVAPQDWAGAAASFRLAMIETLDIDPRSGATYIADLCADNRQRISSGRYDLIVCTEVLEHLLQPFDAVREIHRLLKPGGVVLVTTPFNFRIHGPLPDCWRFTEHGLRALFAKGFEIEELSFLETPRRFLMPIHYQLAARKKVRRTSGR